MLCLCYDYDIHPSHLVATSSGQTGLRWPVGHSGLRVMSGVEPSQHTCRWRGGVCLATLYLHSYRPAPPCHRAEVPSLACPLADPLAARCRQRRRGWSRQRSTASDLGYEDMMKI